MKKTIYIPYGILLDSRVTGGKKYGRGFHELTDAMKWANQYMGVDHVILEATIEGEV